MKIAHVVTYISPDGSFGGPTRVALGQAEALAERGHNVTVYAASPDDAPRVVEQDGYTLKTFPARRLGSSTGFAGMYAPGLPRALRKDLPSTDVAHLHLARDLVMIPAGRVVRGVGIPYVVQSHGMIDASDKLLATPLDILATRPILKDAAAVLVLTAQEDADIREIQPAARVLRIANGIKVEELADYGSRENLVLFLARLHPRKRPLAFVEMAKLLQNDLPNTRFLIVGPDEGEGPAVESAILDAQLGERLEWIGAVGPDHTELLLRRARAYVLPAFDEVFPMTILEALRAGTPIITTDSLGIADLCREFRAAVVTDGMPGSLALEVARVLEDRDLAENLRRGGLELLRRKMNIDGVSLMLEEAYKLALSARSEREMPI